jgi:hypothetical protein
VVLYHDETDTDRDEEGEYSESVDALMLEDIPLRTNCDDHIEGEEDALLLTEMEETDSTVETHLSEIPEVCPPRSLESWNSLEELGSFKEKSWKRDVERELEKLVKREYFGEAMDWERERENIDQFWMGSMPYPSSSTLRTSRVRFWEGVAVKMDKRIGSVAIALMTAAASEAACERAFSYLRLILTNRRHRLTLTHLENCLRLRKNWLL